MTVYLDHPEMWDYQKTSYVYTNGVEYENLAALTRKLDFPSWADIFFYSNDFRAEGSYELNNLLVFGGWKYADYEGFDYSSAQDPQPSICLLQLFKETLSDVQWAPCEISTSSQDCWHCHFF